jgi:RNA polymerase sigma-70 factor (ECF subfamily)
MHEGFFLTVLQLLSSPRIFCSTGPQTMTSRTDIELLNDMQNGNSRSLGELYERYKGPLYAFCLQMLRNEAKAEDAVHDTFIKVARQAHTLTHAAAFRGWIFQIARNETLMILRKSQPVPIDDHDDVWEDQTPLTLLERDERTEIVRSALQSLKIHYREVLLLREFQELSYSDIAAITGSTESAVRSRLFHARRALADKLAPLIHDGRVL